MKKILLIDDEITVRDTMELLLRHHGYDVISAPDGLAGVKLARSNKPDLVISDIVMEPVDGFMTLSILRQQRDTADIPVVLVTGQKDLKDARQGMILGADDYLTKPFTAEDLLATVKNLIDRRAEALATAAKQVTRLKDLLFSPLPDELDKSLGNIGGTAAQIAASPAAEAAAQLREQGNSIFGMTIKLKRDIRHALILAQLNVIAGDGNAQEVLRESEAGELSSIVEEVVDRLAEDCKRKDDMRMEIGHVQVAMGSQALSKLMEELIGNALRHSPPKSPITVRAEVADSSVHLTIENEMLNPVPYTCGDPNKTVVIGNDSSAGMKPGLGVELARRLVELHGGATDRGSEGLQEHSDKN